jgi:N-acetylneuraminate synthase
VTGFAEARRGGRCYVIAEAGSNHNRDFRLAGGLIDAAADAGADAVKFQLFRADRLYPPGAGPAEYLANGEDVHDLVARMELPEEWLPGLARLAGGRGLDLLVTPFDEVSADAVDPFVAVHKLASYELTHEPLLRHVAAKRKPLLLSTGAADLEEVGAAVAVAREAGARELVLLQCTAAYPARLDAVNVGAIADLRERFGCPAGLSDHSGDPVIAPVLAVGLGAVAIEKHVTLDRTLPGPDHAFALEPDELRRMVEAVRLAELARGSGLKEVHPDETELRAFARRSVFATRDIRAGEVLDAGAIAVLRRGSLGEGLPPSAYPGLLGRRATRDVAARSPLTAADVEG